MQRVAACCNVLQYVALCAPQLIPVGPACCSVLEVVSELQCVAVYCSVCTSANSCRNSVSQRVAVWCSVWQRVAACCNVLLYVAVCAPQLIPAGTVCHIVLQCVAACCMCCRVLLCVAAHHTSCSLNTISGGIGCCARPAIVAFSESYKKTHTRTRTYARAAHTYIHPAAISCARATIAAFSESYKKTPTHARAYAHVQTQMYFLQE